MLPQFSIVILSRYPNYARRLIASIKHFHKRLPKILVVCDRHKEQFGVNQIFTTDDFIFARNANRGIRACGQDDIILCNDDMECVMPDFFHILQAAAYTWANTGLISSLIDGGVGNDLQQYPPVQIWSELSTEEISVDRTVCFPCVYIKRSTIEKVGLLDESFVGYGFDDDDYCIRVRWAGLQTMITKRCHIRHGTGGERLERGENWSCSYAKEPLKTENLQIFRKKWQNPHS